jgi:hypothetical protein
MEIHTFLCVLSAEQVRVVVKLLNITVHYIDRVTDCPD